MARTFARVFTSIWQDEDFLALSSGAQRMYIVAITQGTTNMLGVTTWTPKRWSRLSSSTSPATVEKDVAELVEARFAVIDDDTEEMWARTFVRHDGVLDVPNVIKAMTHDFEVVQSARLRAAILEWFKAEFPGGFTTWLCERFPNAFPAGFKGLNKRFLEGLAEQLPEPIPERLPGRFPEPLTEGFPRTRAHTRACAQPSPSPVSEAVTVPALTAGASFKARIGDDERGDVVLRTETTGHSPTATGLVHRLAGACRATNRDLARIEATNVVQWAIRYVDQAVIQDAIFWAETRPAGDEIKLPRAVAEIIQRKARDRSIHMPDFDPRKFS